MGLSSGASTTTRIVTLAFNLGDVEDDAKLVQSLTIATQALASVVIVLSAYSALRGLAGVGGARALLPVGAAFGPWGIGIAGALTLGLLLTTTFSQAEITDQRGR